MEIKLIIYPYWILATYLEFQIFASCQLHSHSVICTSLLMDKKYLRSFYVICVDIL